MEQDIVFRHELPAQLRWSDVDQFGHVNNNVYFALYDMCKTRYFLDVAGEDIFQRMAIVVANINANFLAPIYYPDEIVIQTAMERIGRKSFTLLQRAVNARTREVKCECHTIMVCCDRQQGRAMLMPDDVRQKIEEYEGRKFGERKGEIGNRKSENGERVSGNLMTAHCLLQ